MPSRDWSHTELVLALDLYCRLPFGRFHRGNGDVIQLARLIGRTPSAVALKLSNFARLDPTLQARGIAGMSHGAKGDAKVWSEFFGRWDELAQAAVTMKATITGETLEVVAAIPTDDLPVTGREREAIVKVRIGQSFFRNAVLAAYDYRCCITALTGESLLNASHIIPWATDPENRLNPQNGLCLNALHDRAFDRGLITIDDDYRVVVSRGLKKQIKETSARDLFLAFEGKQISLPTHFGPRVDFLRAHRDRFRD